MYYYYWERSFEVVSIISTGHRLNKKCPLLFQLHSLLASSCLCISYTCSPILYTSSRHFCLPINITGLPSLPTVLTNFCPSINQLYLLSLPMLSYYLYLLINFTNPSSFSTAPTSFCLLTNYTCFPLLPTH